MMKPHENHAGQRAQGLMQGSLVTSGVHFGKRLISRAAKHPLLLFGLGALVGVYVYKKRNAIIEAPEQREDQQVETAEND